MNNQNNTNPNDKYLTLGVGWLRNNKNGIQYISAVAGDKQNGTKLVLKNSTGEEMEITNFAVFFNSNKKTQKSPDVKFVLTVG